MTGIGADVKAMSERVAELVNTADVIYDAVTYQHDATAYRPSHDDFLDGLDE